MTTSGLSLSPGGATGKYFVVSLDSPHEHMKWALVTERYGYDAPEFECGNVRDMVETSTPSRRSWRRGSSLASCRRKRLWANMSGSTRGKAATASGGRGITCSPTNPPRDWKYRTVAVSDSPENVPRAFLQNLQNSTACSMFSQSEAPALDRADVLQRAQRRKEQTR